MSFQFSAETIVRQFETEIASQNLIIEEHSLNAKAIAVLQEERAALTGRHEDIHLGSCSRWRFQIINRCVSWNRYTHIEENDQEKINQINVEIEGLRAGVFPNELVKAAETELEKLRELQEPFNTEVQVQQDQRNAEIARQKAIDDIEKEKQKNNLIHGGLAAAALGIGVLIIK